jgi:predicted RNase H-like HicB family nuclease
MHINKIIYNLSSLAKKIGIDFKEDINVKVLAMKSEIAKLNNRIEFKIEYYPDGSWTAESTNVDGIITGGKNNKDVSDTIKDAIFTYFEIPPYLCKDSLLQADNEPVTITQRVYA